MSKVSLGKGLGAMFPDLARELSERPSYLTCAIEELRPNRFQARKDFNDQDMKALVSSVKESGIIQPIVVRRLREGGYEIIAGERRWRAAQAAGLKSVPVVIREAADRDTAELSIIENIQRAELNPLEEAEGFQILQEKFGLSQEDISARVGKDRSTITNSLRLLKSIPAVKKLLASRELSAGHARAILSLESEQLQARAAAEIVKRKLNVREAERLVKGLGSKKPPKASQVQSRDTVIKDLELRLSKRLMTKVKIKTSSGSKGSLEIRFFSAADLERLLGILLDKN
jgi:ParB family chromosome partitioning protein